MSLILSELKSHLVGNLDDYIPFPKPYQGSDRIKAILLGADPSTENGIHIDTVFNLSGEDKRYFAGIKRNLDAINLSLENLYVQNFCQNYFTKTTYSQKENWWRASAVWVLYLREELDERFSTDVPLLVTSELIFHRLLYSVNEKNSVYYQYPETVPVESCYVKSGRMLIPFFRHWRYDLTKPEWRCYKERLQILFN